VSWMTARRIVAAWFLTIPLTAIAAAAVYYVVKFALGL